MCDHRESEIAKTPAPQTLRRRMTTGRQDHNLNSFTQLSSTVCLFTYLCSSANQRAHRRRESGFRKPRHSRFRSHPSQFHTLPKTARTCFEGPFGEVIRATGPMAKANPFRFSTKYQDDETDLLYYGYRYYNASTGRWNSRDPLGEPGGLNIFGFIANDPLNYWDLLGRQVGGGMCPCEALKDPPDREQENVDKGYVYNCNIIVYLGHNRTDEPHVPTQLHVATCAYASVVACYSSTIPVSKPIPGIEPRPDEFTKLNYIQAAAMADRDFGVGIAAGKALCKNSKCCCKTITVRINCSGLTIYPWDYSLKRVCGKFAKIDCKTGNVHNGQRDIYK